MKAAIAAARHRVLVEFYSVDDQGVAAEMAALLRRKAAEGVHVALLYDSIGSMGTDPAFFDTLRQAGVAVCEFNPVNPLSRPGHWGLVQRNHRKMVAVDSDVALVQHAARSYCAQLLQAGVKVHEVEHAVIHAKTAVVDSVFSSVGSSNLDWRSIVGNNEIDVIVLGDDFGDEMEALFTQDVASARAIDPDTWNERGLVQRLLESLGRLADPLL